MPPDDSSEDIRLPSQSPPPAPPTNAPTAPQPSNIPPVVIQPQLADQPQSQQAQPQAPTTPVDVVYPRSTKKMIFASFAIIVLFFTLILGGGIALAYNDYKIASPPQPIKNAIDSLIIVSPLPKPDRIILESAIAKSTTLKSADQKMDISMSTTSKSFPISTLRLTLDGPARYDDPNSRAAELDAGLEVKFEEASFNGSASLKTVDDILYFKVNEFPFGNVYQQYLSYKNKWFYYKIPEEYLKNDKSLAQGVDLQNIFSKFVENSKAQTNVSSKDVNTYLLEINPTQDSLNNVVVDLLKAYTPQSQNNEAIVGSLLGANISSFTEKIKDLKITATVNKDTFFLKRADLTFDVAANNLDIPVEGADSLISQEPTIFNFAISLELSNYNKQVVIVPPEGAQDFTKVIEELSQSYGGETKTSDEQIKSDVGSLATATQAYYTLKASQSEATYPKDFEELQSGDYLSRIPTPPKESGIDKYQYIKDPQTCEGTKDKPCQQIAIYAPLTQPINPGNVWCWQSKSSKAEEVPLSECSATNPIGATDEDKELNDLNIDMLQLDESVLGAKSRWDLELFKLFSNLLN